MNCAKCGTRLPPNGRFCASCGAPAAIPLYRVLAQGVDAALCPTGRAEVVELGSMTADQLLQVFRSIVAHPQAIGLPAGSVSISVAGPGEDLQFALVGGHLREVNSGRAFSPEEAVAAVSAPAALPAVPIGPYPGVEIEADEEDDEAPGEQFSGVRTGPDVPQVSFVTWGWGCLAMLSNVVHGLAAAVFAICLVIAVAEFTQMGGRVEERVLSTGGIALAIVVLTRLLGRVRVHIGIDPSLDVLWVKVGEQVRSIQRASALTRFELDERTRTEMRRNRRGKSHRVRITEYRLLAIVGGRRVRVPHLPEMSSGPARRSLRAARELLSLLGRPDSPA